MKPNCLICGKPLSKKSAKHCKKHRPVTKETRLLLRLVHLGKPNGTKGKVAWNKGLPAPWAKGRKNTNWGKFGPAHPKWTGRTKLTKSIRGCPKYKEWRSFIFERDDFTCQKCGKRGVYLEADHYPISFASILNEYKIKTYIEAINCEPLWNASGRTLCKKCHPRPGRLPIKDR